MLDVMRSYFSSSVRVNDEDGAVILPGEIFVAFVSVQTTSNDMIAQLCLKIRM